MTQSPMLARSLGPSGGLGGWKCGQECPAEVSTASYAEHMAKIACLMRASATFQASKSFRLYQAVKVLAASLEVAQTSYQLVFGERS